MSAKEVVVEVLTLALKTKLSSSPSAGSDAGSNDLTIYFRHFEEVQMADNNCTWDETTTSAFIKVMVENRDELTSSTFKPSMLSKISEEVRTRTGVFFTVSQLKTKYQRLCNEWRKYHWLLEQTRLGVGSTLGVDSTSDAIYATKEQWQALEGKQEGMFKFRKCGLPFYRELTQLFNQSTVGNFSRAGAVAAPYSNEERQQQESLAAGTFVSTFAHYRDTGPSHSSEPSKCSGKRKISDISPQTMDGSGKKSKDASSVEMLAPAKEMRKEDPYSIPKCMKILNAMNLESHIYCRAARLLCDDNVRQVFMTMKPEMRYEFLANV